MAITPVNPLGWGPKDPVTSAQMNGIDQGLVRAVDGVQGGTYSGPIVLTGASIAGTSSIDTTGLIRTKGLLQAGSFALGSTSVDNLVDGSSVDCIGLATSIFNLRTRALGGQVHIALDWSWLQPNAIYIVVLDHSVLLAGQCLLTWGGAGITHLFSSGAAVDGQPTPGLSTDLWAGLSISTSQILWTVTRGLQ